MDAVASIDIDFLSSIPSETLQASGRHGKVYDLQLQLTKAQTSLEHLIARLWDLAAEASPAGTMQAPDVENSFEVVARRAEIEALTVSVVAAQADVGGIVFLPALDNVAEITKRLATLNRKATKLGTEPITLTITDETLLLSYKPNDETTRSADFAHVFAVLTGTTPKVEGFEFLATITPTEQGNVVKRIPALGKPNLAEVDLTRFHHTGDACEHCKKDRRRSDCYVVYNEQTGETLQVGRTCLRDYMGTNNPEQVVKVLEQVWEFMRSLGSSKGQREAVGTLTFLTHCATLMRDAGGYQKGLGHDAVSNLFNFINKRTDRQGKPLYIEPIDADEAAAAVVLNWARNDWDETSEFATNVKIALASDFMNAKLYGYAGAAFIAHAKWLGREQERKAQADKPVSQHVGTVKERITLTLTVTAIKWVPGYMPDSTKPLILMRDENGNDVKWFASDLPRVADTNADPVIGGTYQVKATIKEHEDNPRFGRATQITRAKFEQTINEPEGSND